MCASTCTRKHSVALAILCPGGKPRVHLACLARVCGVQRVRKGDGVGRCCSAAWADTQVRGLGAHVSHAGRKGWTCRRSTVHRKNVPVLTNGTSSHCGSVRARRPDHGGALVRNSITPTGAAALQRVALCMAMSLQQQCAPVATSRGTAAEGARHERRGGTRAPARRGDTTA